MEVAVPLRHQRRLDELAACEVHRAGHAHADREHVARAPAAARELLAHESTHAREHDAGPGAHIDGFGVAREHLQVERQHGDLEAGRAEVDAQQHAQPAMQPQRLGAAAAGGFALARLVQPARIEQAGDDVVGVRAREREALREHVARRAVRPEDRLQHVQLVVRQLRPSTHHRPCLRPFQVVGLLVGPVPRIVGDRLRPGKVKLRLEKGQSRPLRVFPEEARAMRAGTLGPTAHRRLRGSVRAKAPAAAP